MARKVSFLLRGKIKVSLFLSVFSRPIFSWLNYQRADSRRCEFGGRKRIPVWNLGMRLLVRKEEEEDEMGEANFLGRKQRRREGLQIREGEEKFSYKKSRETRRRTKVEDGIGRHVR